MRSKQYTYPFTDLLSPNNKAIVQIGFEFPQSFPIQLFTDNNNNHFVNLNNNNEIYWITDADILEYNNLQRIFNNSLLSEPSFKYAIIDILYNEK